MKILASCLALFTVLQLICATDAFAQKKFDVQSLGLINAQLKSGAKLYVGQSPKSAIKALGRPTMRGKMYFQAEEDTAVVYYYQANKLYFLKDGLVGFELRDNTLVYGKSLEQAFRIGGILTTETKPVAITATTAAPVAPRYLVDNNLLKDLKPDAKPGKARNINYQVIARNNIRHGDEKYDGWFEILFDGNNRVISIALGE